MSDKSSMGHVEAVTRFLKDHAVPDLARLFDETMECQVLVPKDEATGRFVGGYPFRIPKNAGTVPEYEDKPIRWRLDEHALAVGATGFSWVNGESRWFAVDFDSAIGHKAGLSDEDLVRVREAVSRVPWAELRKSKSGRGYHALVVFAKPVPTKNHKEHADLARVVFDLMSKAAGIDLGPWADVVGGNTWLWHRNRGDDGFALVKPGEPFDGVPEDWRALVPTSRKARRGDDARIDSLAAGRRPEPLDDEHRRLLAWLNESAGNADWEWREDLGLLRCHTVTLREAHAALRLRGVFRTESDGRDLMTANCFAFPAPGGSWAVRRFGRGVQEASTWRRDESGWTRCDYNSVASLSMVAVAHGGTDNDRGGYGFASLAKAREALADLGIRTEGLDGLNDRQATLTRRPGKVVLRVDRRPDEGPPKGFTRDGKNGPWLRSFEHEDPRHDTATADHLVRSVAKRTKDAGLYLKTPRGWVSTSESKVRAALVSQGHGQQQAQAMVGEAVLNAWELIDEPFGPEEPGGRSWNLFGARLSRVPAEGAHPHWDRILKHLGRGLDDAVRSDAWCKDNDVKDGAEYLLLWVAALFQEPKKRLPFLFFFSEAQATGKTTFHWALSFLFEEGRGYVDAGRAITNKAQFNGELRGAVLCAVEEINCAKDPDVNARLKNLVTGDTISIRALYQDSIDLPNLTHWVQTANDRSYCYIGDTDTRIVVVEVPPFEQGAELPKDVLRARLEEEAAAFLYTVLHKTIPASPGRLRIPPVETEAKRDERMRNKSALRRFLDEETKPLDGAAIPWSVFVARFMAWLDPSEVREWSPSRVQREMPSQFPRGRRGENVAHVGNIAWANDEAPQTSGRRLVPRGKRLVEDDGPTGANRAAA
jgi:hypothetical protein